MISIFFLIGVGIYYFGGDWSLMSAFPFAFGGVLVIIKVENWWNNFRDNL
jgi:hypothetical protein